MKRRKLPKIIDIYPDDVLRAIQASAKGPSPPILGKGGPMKDKTKYTRKDKAWKPTQE